ncbi:hypothetical protein [Gramella sp. KN1008]|uniref:hypothetical protein n=1 Tax=Gramella sp. KN1008 TaxID=2529298 RepID=UPI00103B8A01|nr:hypothetical protein [Gramella sp. KN1008]TBW27382.1 hypothetical protein EZJ28_10420 [Gramella sp. KN1008]
MKVNALLLWVGRIVLLIILYIPIWMLGTVAITQLDLDIPAEPGLVSPEAGILVLSVVNTLLIVALIRISKLRGLRLAISLAIAYYGIFTFLTQIETWYFLGDINVSKELLFELFLMGLPVPFLFIPLAVVICRRWKTSQETSKRVDLPLRQLVLRISLLAFIYVIIYWLAGYFIAWQIPQLREFYGSPGEISPFWEHTWKSLKTDPGLFALQLFRGTVFTIIVYSLIRYFKENLLVTALLIGFFLAVPHFGHIISNPLMPFASIRLSHLIETASSTFLYGVIIVLVMQPKTNK